MMLQLPKLAIVTIALTFSVPAWCYDAEMAQGYAKLFAPVQGAAAGKALHILAPNSFVNKVKQKEALVVLDIRTPAETGLFGMTLADSLTIPLNELFTEASLARIPTDRTVVVICQSGTRAAAAGTALRQIGFDNVYILKGGFKALAAYLGPKEANSPAPAAKPATTSSPVPPRPMGWAPMPAPAPYPIPPVR